MRFSFEGGACFRRLLFDRFLLLRDRLRQLRAHLIQLLLPLFHRFADMSTHLRSLARVAGFWRYTLLFKKEIPKKHAMRFGLQ